MKPPHPIFWRNCLKLEEWAPFPSQQRTIDMTATSRASLTTFLLLEIFTVFSTSCSYEISYIRAVSSVPFKNAVPNLAFDNVDNGYNQFTRNLEHYILRFRSIITLA
jgi:hypothetical protein